MSDLTGMAEEIRFNTMLAATTRERVAEVLTALDLVVKELGENNSTEDTVENITGYLSAAGLDSGPKFRECEHCDRELDPADEGNCANCGGYTEVSS